MQPESFESSKKTSVPASTSRTSSPFQHGLHRDSGSASRGSSRSRDGQGSAAAVLSPRASPSSGSGGNEGDKEAGDDELLNKTDDDANENNEPLMIESDAFEKSPRAAQAKTITNGGSPIKKLPNGMS
jgi:hypothetical protein